MTWSFTWSIAAIIIAACLAGMPLGSAITFAVTQRSVTFPTLGLIVGIDRGVYADYNAVFNAVKIALSFFTEGLRTLFLDTTRVFWGHARPEM